MTDPEYLSDWISTTTAAELLGCSRQWVVELINSGKLQGSLITPRSWIVSRASVEALQAARSANSGKKPGKDAS